ncbi:putative arylesterase [Peptoniphilus sp. ING2-D1G]|nr:putative arylesterase [Peptoniphilus sp. ING2-D1G]
MILTAMGDSLVYGYGVGCENSFINMDMEGIEVVNQGINGDTSAGVLHRIENAPDADIILVFVGVNDFLIGMSVDTVTSNIMKILEKIFHRGKKAILCIPFLLSEEEDFTNILSIANNKITKYREKILELKDESLLLIDFYRELKKQPDYSSLFFDGIHPTQKTHDLMKSILIKSMEEKGWIL